MKSVLNFLKELSANNNREWLQAHDKEFKAVKAKRDELAQQFIDLIATVEPEAGMMTPGQCTYRFMRDTRFSPDKSPYKTHIGVFVCPPYGKKSLMSGYYLHIEPGNNLLCGGNYCLPSKVLGAIRNDIRDNIEEYVEIVESPEFKQYFEKVGEEWLKTAPKGFDRNWEYIDYVRPKDFGVELRLSDRDVTAAGFIESLRPAVEQIHRLNRFVNFAITESGLPVMRECR